MSIAAGSWRPASMANFAQELAHRIETLTDYNDLIDALVERARALMARPGVRTLGAGVTVPGLDRPPSGTGHPLAQRPRHRWPVAGA